MNTKGWRYTVGVVRKPGWHLVSPVCSWSHPRVWNKAIPAFLQTCSLGQMTPQKIFNKTRILFLWKGPEVSKRFHLKHVSEIAFSQINVGPSAGHLNAVRLQIRKIWRNKYKLQPLWTLGALLWDYTLHITKWDLGWADRFFLVKFTRSVHKSNIPHSKEGSHAQGILWGQTDMSH